MQDLTCTAGDAKRARNKAQSEKECPRGHNLHRYVRDGPGPNNCDCCSRRGIIVWRCETCDFELCQQCCNMKETLDERHAVPVLNEEALPEGSSPAEPAAVQEWDVARGSSSTCVFEKAAMLPPMVARAALNVVGGAVCGLGYGLGKVGEVVGGTKSVDSKVFQAGFMSWMYANGILPSVQYEPLEVFDASGGGNGSPYVLCRAMADASSNPNGPLDEDMSLTSLIVSNHVSYLDGVVLAALFGAPKILAKAGSRNVPVLGHLMKEMDVVFVERNLSESRHATLDAIKAHCSAWTPGERSLLVFPEGTTTNGESLAPFKKGAFVSGLSVRPVILVYTGQFDPANPTFKETEHGLEEISDAEWCAKFMGSLVHSMHVRVLAPYVPTQDEALDPELYASNMQRFMAKELVRIRSEVHQDSWKAAAGRTHGGMSYKFGDLTRMTIRSIIPSPSEAVCEGTCDEGQKLLGMYNEVACEGTCDEGKKLLGIYKHNCEGRVKQCRWCGYSYCSHHKKPENFIVGHFTGHVCSGGAQ